MILEHLRSRQVFAELAALVEMPREIPVDPVGRAEPGEKPGRDRRVVGPEQEPEEERNADQTADGDEVGQGEDPSRPGRDGHGIVHERSVRSNRRGQRPRTAPSARGSVAAR